MNINEIKMHTPCYVIDEGLLDENIDAFKAALDKYWGNYGFAYSVKTNSLPWILKHMLGKGILAEVVSDTEWDLCRKMGYMPQNMVFNGPIKGKEHFLEAVKAGAYVNIDSEREYEWLKELSESEPCTEVAVALRVNFDLEAYLPKESLTGGHGNRFGYNVENGSFSRMVDKITALKGVRINGLHMHTNSKTRSLEVFENLAGEAVRLAKEYSLELDYVDIGGSFFVKKRDFKAYDDYVRVIASVLSKYFDPEKTALIIEPGSAIISTPVMYLTKVIDVKDTHRDRFAVSDGGRLHIDAFMRKDRYVYEIYAPDFASFDDVMENRGTLSHQTVCGYTCMETDRIMEISDERELRRDDYILYDMTGGYTMSFNAMFIEYQPYVYVKSKDEYTMVRRKWGVDEFLRGNSY